ncbi:hypothetical protein SAY87_007948 [Trapa incisa]|uniref:RING-type E3 ubiquitin transferase n=1 Tax=Trapa incisa TaxID=236973 RepID=A0AAN7QFH4_9MYRT|nr:hypothetical protein SAY87_007948 [Trapa incisa]
MGHRHLFGMPPIFENGHDQSWNTQTEQHHGHIGSGTAGENGCFFYSMEDSSPGVQFSSQWNLDTRSNGSISTDHFGQLQQCQPDGPFPPQDPFMPPRNAGAFGSVVENYFPNASSSTFEGQTPYADEDCGFMDITTESGISHHKRKCSGSSVFERGSSSRYNCSGTSSDIPATLEVRQDMLTMETQHVAWDHFAANHSGHGYNSLSLRGDGFLRNVRRRAGIDLETNSLQSHLPDTPLGSFTVVQPMEHSSFLDIPGPSSNALTTEWNHIDITPAHGRILLQEPCGYGHESVQFLGGSTPIALSDGRRYDFVTSRNPVVSQLYHGSSNQSLGGPYANHSHRSTPDFRPSNNTGFGNASLSEEGLRSVVDTYSRHPRPLSIGLRNSDRSRRSRITNERHQSLPVEACVHGRMGYEGFVDHSALYAIRSTFDQHRDLRLDIDNMSYEELLALGERIGSVNTGLSEDSISKCLKETTYCPLDQMQKEETCVICLEAYKEKDDVGTLKNCSHGYHVNCIKKWLSMKNSCPICKAPALVDDLKEKCGSG